MEIPGSRFLVPAFTGRTPEKNGNSRFLSGSSPVPIFSRSQPEITVHVQALVVSSQKFMERAPLPKLIETKFV